MLRPVLGLIALLGFLAGIACFIGEALFGLWVATDLDTLGSAMMVIAVHAAIAMGLVVARERGKVRKVMAFGLTLCIVAPLGWLVLVWAPRAPGAGLRVLTTIASAWALLLMVVGVALCQPGQRLPVRIVRGFTVGSAIVAMASLPVAAYIGVYLGVGREPIFRVLAIAVVFIGGGLVTGVIMGRMRELVEVPVSARPTIDLTCPRCGKRQTIAVDGDRCGRCGLLIQVQVP